MAMMFETKYSATDGPGGPFVRGDRLSINIALKIHHY